jgi:hypothetical protein
MRAKASGNSDFTYFIDDFDRVASRPHNINLNRLTGVAKVHIIQATQQ